MKRIIGAAGAIAFGLGIVLAAPAQAADTDTIHVPQDFLSKPVSDTRATGHYKVEGTGLRVWTEGNTSSDKVAEYVATKTPLAAAGEPKLDYANTAGGVPGFQLIVDFDADGSADGILVGEPVYDGDWWLNNAAKEFAKKGAPSHTGGSGSENHGTLDQWRAAFPDAVVTAFGFSLGSGVKGDGVINAIDFAGTKYTFAKTVELKAKDQCKKNGWETSTKPIFKNQGECVSSLASNKQ